ncbi:MAG: hypothetical protein R2851_16755 [Caldilineaceae bacterium]
MLTCEICGRRDQPGVQHRQGAQAAALEAAIRSSGRRRGRGGYEDIFAAEKMGDLRTKSTPDSRQRGLRWLYADYKLLYDYFGRGGDSVMKRLGAFATGTAWG